MIFAKRAALIGPARNDETPCNNELPCNDETLCPIHSAFCAEWVGNQGLFLKGWFSILLFVFIVAGTQARAQNQTPANVPQSVGWTDPATGLNWIAEDNGTDVNWSQANDYCANLRLGGYSDWRLPPIEELQGIYDTNAGVQHVKGNLKLSGNFLWSSSQNSAGRAWYIHLRNGKRYSMILRDSANDRALCVRR
jgi:hypothetical protein